MTASALRFMFLADCQMGMYAMMSRCDEKDLDWHAQMGSMVTPIAEIVDGCEWEKKRYRAAIEAANHLRPDFVVMGGDMINDINSESELEALLKITSELDPSIPMKWVPGNHDVGVDAVVPDAHHLDKYREVFGPDYYTFDHGSVRFIVLDTVVIDHPEAVPQELDEQMEFLRFELMRCKEQQRQAIVFGHHPFFVSEPDEPDSYWNLPTVRRMPILAQMKDCGVRIAFSGHWHRNAIVHDGDFEMVISGPVGFPLGDDPPGYRVVDVANGEVSHRYHAL